MDVARKPAADWPHWPDRGAGSPRRDRLERRLFTDSEREAALAQAQETIRAIEAAAAEKSAQIERLEQAVAAMNERDHESRPEPEGRSGSYLLFVWTSGGYALLEVDGAPPAHGDRIIVDGHEQAVTKVASSPLPGDVRRCAYLEPLQD